MNLTKAQQTVAKLRKSFPDPTTVRSAHIYPSSYCVGGALGRGTCGPWTKLWASISGYPDDGRYHFPDDGDLAETLQKYNPALDAMTALEYAGTIAMYNDDREFADAWRTATEALAHPNSPDESVQPN